MAFLDDLMGLEKVIPVRSHFVKSWSRKVFFLPLAVKESEMAKVLMGDAESSASMWAAYVVVKALDENLVRLFSNDQYEAVKELHFQAEFEGLFVEMRKPVEVDTAVAAFTETLA